MMARIAVALLAFLVPPVLPYFFPRTWLVFAVVGLWLVGQLLFWLVFAGPGFLLSLLSSLAAAGLVLTVPPSRFSKHQIS